MRARIATLVALVVAAAAAAALAVPAIAATGPVWAGTWQTNRGPLEITGGASAALGRFGYADSWNEPFGKFNATGSGMTLSGTWSYDTADHAPLDHGPFTLTWAVVNGKATFVGKFTYEANGTVVDWTGTCSAGACAADTTAPAVKALVATGKAGAAVILRYRLFDDSLKATETVTVTRGTAVLWRKVQPLHGAAVAGGTFSVAWKAPAKKSGVLRFTVVARDAAGNSARSTAAITLR
jgi:hypothetical protein